ncbi:hypothetical protein MMC26_006230 [Xylographa opegraphella]|nr:hypothetical protein [Xylographa opegraphella]
MPALHAPTVRTIISSSPPCLRSSSVQRRWAQVHDVRFLATHREPDRIVMEKYRQKLDQKAKEYAPDLVTAILQTPLDQRANVLGLRRIGVKDVAELKRVFAAKIQHVQAAAAPTSTSPFPPPPPAPRLLSDESPSAQPQQPPRSTKAQPGIKTLASFLDVPKTLTLPPAEIASIWRLRHASSATSLCGTVPAATYARMLLTAHKHPQFILPLPRPADPATDTPATTEIHFLQWTFPSAHTATVLFTHLAEYKLRGEFSQPHTTVTHHAELAAEKGVVLLQGNVLEGRGVSVDEGRWLLMCLQKFYGWESRGERGKLLEQFSGGDGDFRLERLVEEAEKVL